MEKNSPRDDETDQPATLLLIISSMHFFRLSPNSKWRKNPQCRRRCLVTGMISYYGSRRSAGGSQSM